MPFTGRLRVDKIEDWEEGYENGEEYKLVLPLRYDWVQGNRTFVAQPGARNNGASIVRLLPDILIDDHGKIDKPVVIHDDIYWAYLNATKEQRERWEEKHGTWTKADADAMLHDGAIDEGVDPVRAHFIWAAVTFVNVKARYNWGKDRTGLFSYHPGKQPDTEVDEDDFGW